MCTDMHLLHSFTFLCVCVCVCSRVCVRACLSFSNVPACLFVRVLTQDCLSYFSHHFPTKFNPLMLDSVGCEVFVMSVQISGREFIPQTYFCNRYKYVIKYVKQEELSSCTSWWLYIKLIISVIRIYSIANRDVSLDNHEKTVIL